MNAPLLLGLVLSGISIYWASPIYQHKPDPVTGNFDVAADIGIWICAHIPGQHHYASPPDWLYNHLSLGPGMLAAALRLHWSCVYLFMLNGTVYVTGLLAGGGWRSLLPRQTDLVDALRMFRYYLCVPFAKLTRRQWLHPRTTTTELLLTRAYIGMEFNSGGTCFWLERLSRYSEADESLPDAGANYQAGLRRRLERDRVVVWSKIR